MDRVARWGLLARSWSLRGDNPPARSAPSPSAVSTRNSPFADLPGVTLTFISFDANPNLTDIQPLLDNTGLAAGDTVILAATNVSCVDVAALQAKGVTVGSDCQ